MILISVITIFILAVFVGLEVISKVPQTLHTPLMSATNAIHGVILVGGILVLGKADNVPLTRRDAPEPTPYWSIAALAASRNAGSPARPR